MKKAVATSGFAILFLAATAAIGGSVDATSSSIVRKRAAALLNKMTREEKIGQLSVLFAFARSSSLEKKIQSGEVGNVLFVKDPAQINTLQRVAVEQSRLHIPMLFGLDVIHGFRTIFPVPIAMAASWDPLLVEKSQSIAAEEARSAGISRTFAPMVDIARDPRWGRIVEGAGEDPYLGSAMAAAQVRGFQGEYIGDPKHIVACVKHFAGYGAAEGGRDYEGADVSDEQLWNVYLPPFHSAVSAGVGSVMSAYMDLNGVPASGNKWLLSEVLRDDWQFKGFVVTDNNAAQDLVTHGFAKDLRDATLRALNAGVNVEMALGESAYSANLPPLLKDGSVTDAQLDDAVRPVLETKIRLGLFEHPYAEEAAAKQTLETPDHRTESRRAAELAAVLLRNEGELLPLKASAYKKIAVIGALADSRIDTAGSWVFANDPKETVTVLSGLRNQAGAGSDVRYAQGAQTGAREFPSPFDALLKKNVRHRGRRNRRIWNSQRRFNSRQILTSRWWSWERRRT